MPGYWRTVARVLVPALLLPLWSCGKDSRGVISGGGTQSPTTPTQQDPPPPEPTPEPEPAEPGSTELDYTVIPGILELEHEKGESPCPQVFGKRITFENTGEDLLEISLLDPGSAKPLSLDKKSVQLEGGESVKLQVKFDCTIVETFTRTLRFKVKNLRTGAQDTAEVIVTVTIS